MLTTWILLALVRLASEVGESSPAPNVHFIAVDDLRPELGCYGVEDSQTQNMDAFAARSTLFRNHFAQVPTCGASRYSLLTGRSPLRTRALGKDAFYRGKSALVSEGVQAARTLPELFRRNGYFTACIGKLSHTPDGKVFGYDGLGDGRAEMPMAWDQLRTPYGPWDRGWGASLSFMG